MPNNKKPFEEGDIIQLKYFDLVDDTWKEGIAQVLGIVCYGKDINFSSYQLLVIGGNIDTSIGYHFLHEIVQDNAFGDSYAHYVGNVKLNPAVKVLYGK